MPDNIYLNVFSTRRKLEAKDMGFPGEMLVIKLWETVADKGIGSLFRPWQIRREGQASIEVKRNELLALADAERLAEQLRRGQISLESLHPSRRLLINPECTEAIQQESLSVKLLRAANDVSIADKIRQEVNITKALLHAEESLVPDPQTPPNKTINDDWIFRWRDSASQISNDELQQLWGRLLAGEIKAPGTYSLRTLEFLRTLSQTEAMLISKLSRFVVANVIYRDAKDLLENEGISYQVLLDLQQLGIVQGVEGLGFDITWKSQDKNQFVCTLESNSMVLIAHAADPNKKITLPIYQLTTVGRQVLSLGKFEPHIAYLKRVGEHLKTQECELEIANYVRISPNEIQIFNALKF